MKQTFIYSPRNRRALFRLIHWTMFSALLATFIPLLGNTALAQTPFTCQNGVSYRIQGNPSALYQISLRTGVATLLTSAATLGNRNLQGLGYNPLDNFLYASISGTNTILRIGSDGASTVITVPTLAPAAYAAGDVGPDGVFYLYVPSTTTMAKINLSTLAVTTITLSAGANLQDISISSDGASIYGISTGNGNLVRYATTGGAQTLTDVGFGTGLTFSTYFGSNAVGTNPGNTRGNLYAIDNATSTTYEVVGPEIPLAESGTQISPVLATAITNTDGARCINSLATNQGNFVCTAGQAFIVTGTQGYPDNSCTDAGNSVLAEYNLQTGALVATSTQLINNFNTRTTINNLGYNVTDGRLWGYRNGTNQLVRIGTGRTVDYFAINGLSNDCIYGDQNTNNSVFVAGDVNTSGVMYLFNGFNGDRFIRVDLNPASATYLQKLSDVVVTGATLIGDNGVKDLAFNPIDNQLYGIRAVDNHLLRVNPTTGVATDLGLATGIGTLGSGDFLVAFFDNLGALYTQRSGGDDVYKIPNVSTGARTGSVFIANGAAIGGNGDGARCPFSTIESYTISGTVFNDANGLLGTPANTVDGTAVSTLGSNTLYANLVNTSGNVVTSTTLASGTFSFTGVSGNSSFSVILTNAPVTLGTPPLSTTLAGVANTGEFVGTGAGSDGTPDGVISVSVAAANVTNVKLGVDRLPVADPKTATAQLNPGGTTRVTVPTLTGSDPEDGTYTGVSVSNTVIIQSLPTNGTLYYNNAVATVGQVIPNYNPALLQVDPSDGPISVTFTYSERDAAGKDSPAALVTVPFTGVTISGTVFNDANGLVDGIVNGTAVSSLAGNTFSANLVGPAGTVLATTTLTGGAYSFTDVTANTSYSVVLSNTPGTVGSAPPSTTLTGSAVNTGEHVGATAGSDGTPNGVLPVTVVTSNVTDANFGVDRLPTADPKTATTQPNPGGTNTVVVPTLTGSDPEDGTYTGTTNSNTVVIQSLPSNGTLAYNGTPVTVGQVIPNYNPTLLTVDPADGPVSVTFTYSERDAAGLNSPAALVTIPFANALVSISGTVFNDANGLVDGIVNGTAVSSLAGNTFSANLVGPAGTVLATTTLTGGAYTFTGVSPSTSYSVVLSNTPGTVGSAPPSTTLTGSVVNTGENVGVTAGSDGTPNGVLPVTVVTTSVTNANFGLDRRPTADPKTATTQANPGGTNTVVVPTLTGSDPEDGTYTGTTNSNTVVIQSLPSNGTLAYNGTPVTAGQVIPNYNPTLLTVDPADGPVSVTFTYSERDAAGLNSPAALVTIPFGNALVSISGTVFNDANGLVDGIVNGTAVSSLAGNTFSANLVGPAGTVLATTTLTGGAYSFTSVTANTSYSVVLSNTPGTVGSAPPSTTLTGSVVNTGENVGATAGSDGTPNGVLPVTVATTSVTNANFGLDRRPTADPKTATVQVNPGGTNTVVVPTLTGSDPEDGTYTGTTNSNTVVIQSLPSNGTLAYNGTPVTAGQVIPNYNPTLLTVDPADGPVSVTLTYSERDAAGLNSPAALVTIPFANALVSLSGNVFNDANGSVFKDANESAINGPTLPVYVSLVQAGSVVATVPVSSTGGYSFTAVSPNTSYSVVLTTNPAGSATPSLPTSWTNTGEELGGFGLSDGSPNGILAVAVATTSVTNANFGIEQLPTAGSGINTVFNPGGTTPVTVPTNTFSNTSASTDVTPGFVVALRVVAFPSNTTSLTIGGSVYTASSPEFSGPNPFGVEVDTDGSGNPLQTFQVDPTNDSQPVSIPFRVLDNALKFSANIGTAVLNFTGPVTISGMVYNDANGLVDNTVNGIAVSVLASNAFSANLIGPAGTVVATTMLSGGAYSFTGVTTNTSYSVVLSNTPGTIGSAPPSTALLNGVVNTGENIGAGAGSDGTPNGVIAVAVGTTSVTNVNFGVERLPTAEAKTATSQLNPGGANTVTVPTLTGIDPEDGTYTGVSLSNTVVIQSLPTNGTLYYNGLPITTAGQVIPNYNPALLTLDPVDGPVSVTFTYSERDAAGLNSPPALVTIPFVIAPDLTPIIYARPSTVYGTTNLTVVVDVVELLNVPTSGLITVKVTRDAKVSLVFPPSATLINGRSVQNSIWTYDGSDPNYYVLTTTEVVPAGDRLSFGFTGVLTPGATTGTLTISPVIIGGSGSEIRVNNNVDADKIDYFQQ
ncbi:DUF6923 family protein [Spirosoma validum]|uniref:DUF6923 domain-containing protein n=1 Tax=Spirosoma validum TaxID=2771355 RepID=A0A927AX35_9BACT|nr:hypothetical protein [Spirosoma validum]MBD2751394.1 hypothetical protein [Spirosoma validum]